MINQKYSVSINVENKDIGKKLERTILSVGGFRFTPSHELADLLIIELNGPSREAFKRIETLTAPNADQEVFVTSQRPDIKLLRQIMRLGVKEFLDQPLKEDDVRLALEAFKERRARLAMQAPEHDGQIFHVMGAKGGVGTTTVAVNLSMFLQEIKTVKSVALVDLNMVFGETPLFLSVKPTYHWGQIAENMNRLDSTFLLNALAKHASGVHILPSANYLNGHPPVTSDIMAGLLSAMKKTFDVIVVDGGQSLDGPALKTMEMSHQVILVTLLSLPCLYNTNNVLKSLASSGAIPEKRIRLVINRYLKKTDITIKEAEQSVQKKIFWNIPNDYKTTMSAINRGMPLNEISPKANITKSLETLAGSLAGGEQKVAPKRKWRWF